MIGSGYKQHAATFISFISEPRAKRSASVVAARIHDFIFDMLGVVRDGHFVLVGKNDDIAVP